MTSKTSFTEDEWFLVSATPSLIGAAMAAAGKSGVIGSVKEFVASAKSVMEAERLYPDNQLIGDIVDLSDRDAAKEQAKQHRDKLMARVKEQGVSTPEALSKLMLDDCRQVSQLLSQKADQQEAQQYREWALHVGEKVAHAAKEGSVLGFGGERFSEPERQLMDKIRAALGPDLA